jgi:hypothetical protein
MGNMLRRKMSNYMEIVSNLEDRYVSIRPMFKDLEVDEEDEEYDYDRKQYLIDSFELLLEFDKMMYKYHALKSYFDTAKLQLTEEERKIIEKMDKLGFKYEREFPIPDLIMEFPELAIIRRQLQGSAKECGKIAYQYKQSETYEKPSNDRTKSVTSQQKKNT